jgi:hypothetical protein
MMNRWPTEDTLVIIGWTNFYRSHYISEKFLLNLNPFTASKSGSAILGGHKDQGFKAASIAWVHRDPNAVMNDNIRLMYSAKTWLEHRGYQYMWVNTLGDLQSPEYDLALVTNNYKPCEQMQCEIVFNPRYYQEIDQFAWLKHNCPGGQVKWGKPDDHQHWDSASLALWADHLHNWAKEKGYLSSLDQSNFKD